MLDGFFGEGQTAFKVLFALIVVLGLLALAFWALRRFGGERLGGAAARGRQPRLAVIDAAMVDGRRRLVLIRRDNVEHLLIIGGPTDVVIEQNIVRASGAPSFRPAAPADPLPRTVPLGEGSMWPLQPEPASRVDPPRMEPPRAEPPRMEPPRMEPPRMEARAHRPAPVEQAFHREEEQRELPPPRERARPRAADPLAGLAEELGRDPEEPRQAEQARHVEPRQAEHRQAEHRHAEPARHGEASRPAEQAPRAVPRRAPRPQPAAAAPAPAPAAEEAYAAAADQNLAEMAQRLEAALRRPAKGEERSPAQPQPVLRAVPAAAEEPAEPIGARPGALRPARADAGRPVRADGKAPQRSLYDSLEQEMASLLGRPEKT
jgi:flagellar biogenesis protein FliO